MFGLYRKEAKEKEVLLSEANEDQLKSALRRLERKNWKDGRKEIYQRLHSLDKNLEDEKTFNIILTNAQAEIRIYRNKYLDYEEDKSKDLRPYITNAHELLEKIVETHPFVRDYIKEKNEQKEKFIEEVEKIAEERGVKPSLIYNEYQQMENSELYKDLIDEE